MESYITSSLVGGRNGDIFQDIFIRAADGDFVINNTQKSSLDSNHPIQQIKVSHGWIVDGISITYQLEDKSSVTFDHGSQFSGASVVTLSKDEKLVGVFGRAGYQEYYKRDMINNIGFCIFDTGKGSTRVVGPFGGSNGVEGTTFYSSDVLAFGGFAKPDDHLGLSGLFFYRK